MNIRDIESRAGMDRATIRFYEKEGLICPVRKENGYRDYSQAELDHLLKIKLLRQLGISLEQIKSVQQGSTELTEIISKQISVLSKEQSRLIRCKEVCCRLQEDRASYSSIDPDVYLAMLSAPAEAKPRPVSVFTEDRREPTHPFRRYAARMLDHFFLCEIVEFLIFVVFRFRGISIENVDTFSSVAGYICWWLQLPVSAVLISKFGFTPGKWLLGMKLMSPLGRKMDYSEAYARECAVFRYGMGFGIPFYAPYRMYKCMRESMDNAPMGWDEEAETEYKENIRTNIVLTAVAFALCVGISVWTGYDMFFPSNRNGIETVGEFAENYRDYQTVLGNVSNGDLMTDDGTFYVNPNTIYIGINGPTEINQFQYETEAEKLKQIHYDCTLEYWFGAEGLTVPYDCVYAACAVMGSTKGVWISDIQELITELRTASDPGEYEHVYESFTVQWSFGEPLEKDGMIQTVDFRFCIILD